MDYGATTKLLWIVVVIGILAAVLYFKRNREPPK
jgi:hypothetical protein